MTIKINMELIEIRMSIEAALTLINHETMKDGVPDMVFIATDFIRKAHTGLLVYEELEATGQLKRSDFIK